MSIYAFGDIHGEFFKLKTLIGRVFPTKSDKIIFLGDYIDRGPMSFEVIEFLINFNKRHDCVFLMGNHEEMFLNYIENVKNSKSLFIINGGFKTTKSYKKNGWNIDPASNIKVPESHYKFFKNLLKYYETDEYIFVHAGIHPNTKMEDMPDEILLWERGFSHMPYKGKVVVYGHYPDNEILNEKYKICIDTGACFEGMGDLTCVKLPEREFTRQGNTIEDMEYERNN